MRTPDKDGTVLPVIIQNPRGEFLGTALCNQKGFQKTIEQNQPWILDGSTGRLLPAEGCEGFASIQRMSDHVLIVAQAWQQPAEERASLGKQSGQDEKSPETGSAGAGRADRLAGDFLLELQRIIYRRKKDMPPGSYTTHLFEKGEDKIRKKTGEEALELILAKDADEMAGEAADLLYHMMVLLAAREMDIRDAIAVLMERHGG